MSLAPLITLFLLFSSLVFADLNPPKSMQANVMLAKILVADFKTLNDQVISYFVEIQTTIGQCRNGTADADETNSNQRAPDHDTRCLRSFTSLVGKGDLILLKFLDYSIQAKDEKFANFGELRERSIQDVNDLKAQVEKAQEFLRKVASMLSARYLAALNYEFQEAARSGKLKGVLEGQCYSLKNQFNFITTLLKYNLRKPDYGILFNFGKRLGVIQTLAEAIQSECSSHLKPANYHNLIQAVDEQLKTLNAEHWFESKCQGIKELHYRTELCQSQRYTDPYIINLLMEAGL